MVMGGKVSTHARRIEVIQWAENIEQNYSKLSKCDLGHISGELKKYFALTCIARNKNHSPTLRARAEELIFRVRCYLERAIIVYIKELPDTSTEYHRLVRRGRMFGFSKKQGVSLRFSLSTCVPTPLCASRCYAHDALDAMPSSVTRGAINTAIGELWEHEPPRKQCLAAIVNREVSQAVAAALKEAKDASLLYQRLPRIRLAHVGEAVSFPQFINFLGQRIVAISGGAVIPVLYTRHPDAHLIDREAIRLLFTLDPSSEDRKRYVPQGSPIVYSGFGGVVSTESLVTFLEHHPHQHYTGSEANLCPVSTLRNGARSCDQARCSTCFDRK
jgi:hypothetical protein